MSHRADTSGVPYISSVSPSAVSVAGSQTIVITGNALSPTTEVDISSLGVITNSVFAHVTSVSQTLTLTVTVAAIPDPVEEIDITCSNGGVTGNTVVVGHGAVPMTISGLSLWLDADDASTISETSTDVSEWRNKAPAPYAGLFDFAQSTSTNQPRVITNAWNGKPVIRFDGTDEFLNGNGDTTYRSPAGSDQGATFFAVIRSYPSLQTGVAAVLGSGLTSSYNQGSFCWWLGDWNGLYSIPGMNTHENGKVVSSNSGFSLAGDLYVYTNDDDADSIRVNGASSASGGYGGFSGGPMTTIYPTTSTDFYMRLGGGAGTTTAAYDFAGDIAELIAYNSNIDDADRATIEAYLATKWGITLP